MMGYKNNMIESLMGAPEAIEAIVQLAHPGYSGKYKVYAKFDWVCIESYGMFIGISFDVSFFGAGHELKDFQKEVNRGYSAINVWRFSDDSNFRKDGRDLREYKHTLNIIFEHFNIKLPTAKQLMDYYYED